MGKEVELLLPLLHNRTEHSLPHIHYHTGTIGPHEVAIMQCGIGKVNAALGTQALIHQFSPELIINSGVAGGTGSGANVLDVILATGVAYHDFYCLCEPWGQVPDCPPVFPTFPLNLPSGVIPGLIVSGDLFVSTPQEVQTILSHFPKALAVDMESGAIAQTCFLNKVPFACLRVLSDTPGKHQDNASQYYDFWKAAPEKTFETLKSIISTI